MNSDNQSSSSTRFAAYIMIGLGAFLLLGPVFHISLVGLTWPFFVIIPGAVFLYFAYTGNKAMSGFSIPGALITGTGLILLYQSATNRWESWAYVWTLYAVFLGWAFEFMSKRTGNGQLGKVGRGFIKAGLVAFVALYIMFELLVFHNILHGWGGFVLPAALVILGLYMLVGSDGFSSVLSSSNGIFTGPRVINKAKNGYSPAASDRLRKRIDETLAEIEGRDDETDI
jgi:hypothetical protein